jgi:hypothetical protein
MCEGWSLEIRAAFRGAFVRQDRTDHPTTWLASVNAGYVGEYLDRATAMARVEDWPCWKTGNYTGRLKKTGRSKDALSA